MMALFMVIIVVVSSQAVLKNLATQGRRQREEEAIWRGNQWIRAVRMFYRKTGHYPRTADDLQKGLPGLHFLRPAAYKDPMNPDGSWRFIYTNATGQLIGSVRYATLQQMAMMDLKVGMPQTTSSGTTVSNVASNAGNSNETGAGGTSADSASDSSSGGTQNSQQAGNSSSEAQPQTPAQSTGAAQNSVSNGSITSSLPLGFGAAQSPDALAQLQPTGPVDGPVLGAFLTGVGSKVERSSVKVYHGGKKYQEWEFIWNPLEDQALAMRQGLNNPQGQGSGQPAPPAGTGSSSEGSPDTTPPTQ